MRNEILLITGTCASGKTTVGEILSRQYGYKHIDGDQFKRELKKRRGLEKLDWDEIHEDLISHAIELSTRANVVISHVVLPPNLGVYQAICSNLDALFRFIILMPSRETVYSRNKNRTCWSSPTPKKFIDEFYDSYIEAVNALSENVLDNSNQSPLETATQIMMRLTYHK